MWPWTKKVVKALRGKGQTQKEADREVDQIVKKLLDGVKDGSIKMKVGIDGSMSFYRRR